MSECDRKKFEQMLAFHSAPTLLGVKCANLFAVKQSELSVYDIEEYFRNNTILQSLSVHVMCKCRERALLYVYHKELLNTWLSEKLVSELLESCGYNAELSVEEKLDTLEERISCGSFPHEIGIFLGYPVDDVLGFIENKGANYLFCGFWKVYSDPCGAKRAFDRYVHCREYLCNNIKHGVELDRAVRNFRRI